MNTPKHYTRQELRDALLDGATVFVFVSPGKTLPLRLYNGKVATLWSDTYSDLWDLEYVLKSRLAEALMFFERRVVDLKNWNEAKVRQDRRGIDRRQGGR